MDVKSRRVRVLVVDDSAVVRQVLVRELSSYPEIEIVGVAGDPYIARDKILREKPDVVTLDIEMPKMDGLTFLKKLMAYHPLPVIILSSLAETRSGIVLEALEAGAVDVFAKPGSGIENLKESIRNLAESIISAASANIKPPESMPPAPAVAVKPPARNSTLSPKVIAIGASTGGTEALKTVLCGLSVDAPAVVAVIHMPETFTKRFAERLNSYSAIEVREAAHGDCLNNGLALIARGGSHLLISKKQGRYIVEISSGPPICRQRPSVEVLFQSVARAAGAQAMGIIMTGMGSDGADGLLEMRKRGAYTVAQNEESCVVFGMPKEAIQRGAAVDVMPLNKISAACIRWSSAGSSMENNHETLRC